MLLILGSVPLAGSATVSSRGSAEAPLERALRQYPPRETNAAALDVERLAAPLGIDLVPSDVQGRSRNRPGKLELATFENIKELLPNWLKKELQRPSGEISAPPRELAAFLDSRTDALAALCRGILRGEEPVWAERLDLGERSPRLKLIGHIYLQELLISDALRNERAGRANLAAEILEASWRLNDPSVTTRKAA